MKSFKTYILCIKLVGSIKSQITKNENGESVPPHLKITEVVLVQCNIVHKNISRF